MKQLVFLLLALLTFPVNADAGKKKNFVEYDYELSLDIPNVAATSGFKVFKVWSYCKKRNMLTKENCMRNAVHGILFKGLVAADTGTQGNVPALVPEGYETHEKYFDHFFESGEFKQFIQFTSKGAQQAGDVVKTSNKEWKVGLIVQVNVNALRVRLEKDGIIKSVKGIFTR